MRKIHGYLLLLPLAFGVASCGGGGLDWGNIDAYKEATELKSSYVASEQLTITIENADNYLKDISKDKIIVQSRASLAKAGGFQNKELNGDALKKSAISDYNLGVGKNVVITINSYESTTYCVIFNKAATKDGKFAFATASLVSDDIKGQSYVKAEESIHLPGDQDPQFVITFGDLDVADTAKIAFSGCLNELTLSSCSVFEGNLTVSTSGRIAGHGEGHLILQKGFFANADEDIDLVYHIDMPAYSVDNSSFRLENGEFSFILHLDAVRTLRFAHDSINVGKYVSKRVEPVDGDFVSLRVFLPFSGTLEEAIAEMAGQPIRFSSNELAGCFEDMPFQVVGPDYDVECSLVGTTFTLRFYHRNTIAEAIPYSAVVIDSPQLILSGDSANAEMIDYTQTINGFTAAFKTSEALSSIVGTLAISGADRFKTLWGGESECPVLSFDCDAETNGASGEFNEEYCQKVMNASPSKDDVAKVLNFTLLTIQYGIARAANNPVGAIGSLLGLLDLFGLNGHSGDATIQDVLSKLNDISNQLKAIDRKIDALHRQLQDNRIATEIGMTKILFNQYHSAWESFNTSTIRPTENILRDYTADMRSYMVKFVWDANDVELNLKYFESEGKTSIGAENPYSEGYTIDGYRITSTKTVSIKKTYFQEAADLARRAQGYSKDFDIVFRKCLAANMKADYPAMSETDREALCNDVYAHIRSLAQFASTSETRAKEMANCFINFAEGILSSQMDNLFHMLESLYNFQSEARIEIIQFRTKMKILLDKYAGFATAMAQYCPGIQKQDITSSYEAAVKRIREQTYLQKLGEGEVYCYPTHSKIVAKVVNADFHVTFTGHGENDCVFHSGFAIYDQNATRPINLLNLNALITETDLNIIYARVLNALRTAGQTVSAIDFYKYLKENKVITDALINNGKVKYEGKEVITSFQGTTNALTSTDFMVKCVADGVGDYFVVGGNYQYGVVHGRQWWSGGEANGAIYNLDSHSVVSNVIERYARYDQSHWYWSTDEHWAYESLYGDVTGRTAFMFFKGQPSYAS